MGYAQTAHATPNIEVKFAKIIDDNTIEITFDTAQKLVNCDHQHIKIYNEGNTIDDTSNCHLTKAEEGILIVDYTTAHFGAPKSYKGGNGIYFTGPAITIEGGDTNYVNTDGDGDYTLSYSSITVTKATIINSTTVVLLLDTGGVDLDPVCLSPYKTHIHNGGQIKNSTNCSVVANTVEIAFPANSFSDAAQEYAIADGLYFSDAVVIDVEGDINVLNSKVKVDDGQVPVLEKALITDNNTIKLVFSEELADNINIRDLSERKGLFNVTGKGIFDLVHIDTEKEIIIITITTDDLSDYMDTILVKYIGSTPDIKDIHENILAFGSGINEVYTTDGMAPSLISAQKIDDNTIELIFHEPITVVAMGATQWETSLGPPNQYPDFQLEGLTKINLLFTNLLPSYGVVSISYTHSPGEINDGSNNVLPTTSPLATVNMGGAPGLAPVADPVKFTKHNNITVQFSEIVTANINQFSFNKAATTYGVNGIVGSSTDEITAQTIVLIIDSIDTSTLTGVEYNISGNIVDTDGNPIGTDLTGFVAPCGTGDECKPGGGGGGGDPIPPGTRDIGEFCQTAGADNPCAPGLVCAQVGIGLPSICLGTRDYKGCQNMFVNETPNKDPNLAWDQINVTSAHQLCATGLRCRNDADIIGTCISDFGASKAEELKLGEESNDLRVEINRVINILLSFLAIIGVIIILYGGILWATAGGNDEQVGKARKVIIAAAIGLIIIGIAWTLTSYILNLGSSIS